MPQKPNHTFTRANKRNAERRYRSAEA